MRTSPVSFGSDNHSGIHPKILAAINDANQGQVPSYGTDPLSELAVQEFHRQFGRTDMDVHFVLTGTAANVLAISSLIKSYHAIIASDVSHLELDECGAPEKWIGGKIRPIKSRNGKISAEVIKQTLIRKGDQHYSQSRLISLSQPTELGTVYTESELAEIRDLADREGLLLHIDGARLIHALTFLNWSFKDFVDRVRPDAISFGGTKNGLLQAEAVLLFGENRPKDFRFLRKQALQLPSKTRFIANQFLSFFNDQLWREISIHSRKMAQHLAQELRDIPEVRILYPVESNAVFVNIPREWIKPLREKFFFYVWDEMTWDLRWMTTFDTQVQDVDNFVQLLRDLRKT